MSIIESKKYISNLLLMFFITSLLFPTIIINKLVFLIIIMTVIINYRSYKFNVFAPFLIFLIFFYGFLFSFLNNADNDLRLQLFFSVLVLFLIYPINKYKIDVDYIVKVSGLIIAIYTGVSFLIIVTFIDSSFSSTYLNFFVEVSAGSNSLRDFVGGDGTISFHIGTVPFIYLSFVLYMVSFIEKKKTSTIFAMLILLITILVSTSRGSIFSCIIAGGYIVFFKSKIVNKILFLAICIPIVLIFIAYLIDNTSVFSSGDSSNFVKIGHFESFLENINFTNFLFGEGLASIYFSKGRGAMLAQTEITPVDMLRYFGFILAPLLYFVIFFPVKKLASYLGSNSLYAVLFLIYVLNSFTNPTMFNSYGLLVVLWYWSKILNQSNLILVSNINKEKLV